MEFPRVANTITRTATTTTTSPTAPQAIHLPWPDGPGLRGALPTCRPGRGLLPPLPALGRHRPAGGPALVLGARWPAPPAGFGFGLLPPVPVFFCVVGHGSAVLASCECRKERNWSAATQGITGVGGPHVRRSARRRAAYSRRMSADASARVDPPTEGIRSPPLRGRPVPDAAPPRARPGQPGRIDLGHHHGGRPPGPLRRGRLGSAGTVPPRLGTASQRLCAPRRGHGRGRLPGRRPGPARVRRYPRAPGRRSAPSPATAPGWDGSSTPPASATSRSSPATRSAAACRRRSCTTSPNGWPRSCWPTPSGVPTWALLPNEVRTMAQRPFWDWGRHFGADLLRSPRSLRVLPTLLEDFVPNLLRNPLGMFRTGEVIRRADLVAEVRAIAARGIPVSVAWSDRDGLVPRSAFDDLRRAAGVEGVVVEGSPRLADRRAGRPSASWPSARWWTPAGRPAGRRARPSPCRRARGSLTP